MNQERFNAIKNIMESMPSTAYLKPTNKCKMQNILQFIRLQKLNLTLEDVIGYYDYSLFGGGKKALLLTSDFIYSSYDGKITTPLVFSEILSTRFHENDLIVTKKDGEETIYLPIYNQYVSELINAILKQYPTKTIEQEAEEVSQRVQKALEEKLAELERLEKEAEEKKREEEIIAKEKAERYANLSNEEKELVKKAEERKHRIEKELASTSKEEDKGVDGLAIEKEFIANPKASPFFRDTLEQKIFEISKAVALIPKSHFSKKNITDIQHHFKNVNINDVVYFYDGWTVHKDRLWAVVTTKELLVSNGFKLSLLGISRVELSNDQSYAHITYLDTKVSVYYKKFSSYLVQTIVQGTINAYAALWNYAWQLEQKKNYKDAFYYHLETAVNGGNVSALNSLGIYYFNGWYVKENKEHSYEWYEKASNAGNTYAMSNLGLNYKNDKQYDKAWIHLNRGLAITTAKNKASIMNTAGVMHLHGYGTPKDYNKALSYFKQSSSLGNMYATYNLASHSFYYDYDFAKGIEYTILGIQQKHKTLKKLLGDCYRYGKLLPKNEESALHWYNEACAEDVSSAYLSIGDIYHDNKCYDEAIEEYNTGIEKGNNYGHYSLYKVYSNPEYPGYNLDEALYSLEKGVQKGSPSSMIQLAKMYLEGKGVVQDYAMAKELLEQAKAKEDLDANGYLALFYLNGWGVNVDKKKADELFDEAINDHNTATTYEYAKVCLTHKDYDANKGIQLLFMIIQRIGHKNCKDAKKTLIDYLSTHPYNLMGKAQLLLIEAFNDLYEEDASILDKKAELERLTNTPIPVYAIKKDIDKKTLKTKTIKEKLCTLLDIVANNPKHYEACTALGKLYFSIGSYKEALFYHQIAYNVNAYKDDLGSLFQYYYLCVEVKHEYDKGKLLYHMINSGYQGNEIFVHLVHKHRENVKMYEYSLSTVNYAMQNPDKYSELYPDFNESIIRYHNDLKAQYSKVDPTLITSLYQKAKKLTNSYDKKLQEMEKMYRDDYENVYHLAKKGCIAAIQQYLKYGDHVYLSYEDYARLANVYALLNESATDMTKLLAYHKSSKNEKEIVNTLREAVLFYNHVSSLNTHFTHITEVDEAFYNILEKEFANSRDLDTIAIMTRLIKKEDVTTLDIVEKANMALTSILNNEAIITDIDQLNELYNTKRYKLVYENIVTLASKNNPEAHLLLGKLYHYGHGVQQDYELAKQWYTKAKEANNIEAALLLTHIEYEVANSIQELEKVYDNYVQIFEHTDTKACENVKEYLDLTNASYDLQVIWKLREYELGNRKVGNWAAMMFLIGLCSDAPAVLSYFTQLADKMDPLGLRVCAAAYHLGIGCEMDTRLAQHYEKLLYILVTDNVDSQWRGYGWMFNCSLSCKDPYLKETVVDYLISINKYSSKNVLFKTYDGNRTITILFNTEEKNEVSTYIKPKDSNKIHSIKQLALVTFNRFTQGMFSTDFEAEYIVVGDNHEKYWYAFDSIKEHNRLDIRYIKEKPLSTKSSDEKEDFTEQVNDCWALYDKGKYEEAYKKVLPLAKKGVLKAINMVGLMLNYGEGVPCDLQKAQEWYQLGINKHYPACYTNMGNLYYKYSSDETVGKKYAYHYYVQVIHKNNAVVCKRALDILLSGLVDYNEEQKQKWINRLLELGEEEYVQSLNKES
ncbi:MAG: SEL1-like repeat protein [Erysipelotrichaceae bacterium]|nr:SEL1-like repeat protein [Erysipelotrichaceae bacterium]